MILHETPTRHRREEASAVHDSIRLGHELGWSFTPLSGKRPTLKGWQEHPRESLEEALDWAASGNVGLRTGRTSGVVVIDADEGADMASAPASCTAIIMLPCCLAHT